MPDAIDTDRQGKARGGLRLLQGGEESPAQQVRHRKLSTDYFWLDWQIERQALPRGRNGEGYLFEVLPSEQLVIFDEVFDTFDDVPPRVLDEIQAKLTGQPAPYCRPLLRAVQ